MKKIQSICVYCGSSNRISDTFRRTAQDLGFFLAENNLDMVFGGGNVGLMGVTADAALEKGGKVIGFIPEFLDDLEGGHRKITELHVVKSMHERKQMMFERSDGFIILPGGLGTLDEMFEVMTWKQIGLHKKPIVIYDPQGYYGHLVQGFFEKMIEEKFAREEDRRLFTVISNTNDLLVELHKDYENGDFVSKWG